MSIRMKLQNKPVREGKRRTRASSKRLQALYDTGNYICTHRRYSPPNLEFHASVDDLPISYDFLEVKLVRKVEHSI